MSYGILTIGRTTLRETFVITEDSGDLRTTSTEDPRTVSIIGEESSPPLSVAAVIQRHDDILSMRGNLLNVTWSDKPDRNGFYMTRATNADLVRFNDSTTLVKSLWKIDLSRIGSESETDIESRLAGTVRANNFSLLGERWHAPSIGHYAYYTGSAIPSSGSRASADGAITVYRGLSAGVSPRWGVSPGNYPGGRVRILDGGSERAGVNTTLSASGWELQNALVRVRPITVGGTLEVAAYDGAVWDTKNWNVTVAASGAPIATWDGATILRNDYEMCVVRLTENLNPGRATLDLTLRRGSRFVEGYLQRGNADTLSAHLNVLENATNPASGGYVVATSNDASANKATAGSAHTFAAHANLGVTLANATALDFYLGAVVNGTGATAVDVATVLRDQYIGALAEVSVGVRR